MGGWHYFYDPADGATMFKMASASEVIDELRRYRTNNRTLTGKEEEEVWGYYCSRHPERCGQVVPAGGPVPFLPRDQTPEFFGPIIWRFLNLAATRFDVIGRDFFLATLLKTYDLMTCPDCREHWNEILGKENPSEIRDTKSACAWVNRIHNLVNARTGKAPYPYARMVTEYGAPLP